MYIKHFRSTADNYQGLNHSAEAEPVLLHHPHNPAHIERTFLAMGAAHMYTSRCMHMLEEGNPFGKVNL